MPIQDWKIVEWRKSDPIEPKQLIEKETDDTWGYYDSVQLHRGRVDFIFVDQTE